MQLLGLLPFLVLLAAPSLLDLIGGEVLVIVPPQLLSLMNGGGVRLGRGAPLLSLLADLIGRSFDMLIHQVPALEGAFAGASVWIL